MFNSPYAFPNPYQMNMPQQNQALSYSQQIVKVNGRNGAEAFQMMPNSSALLLDESAPVVWLAQTDGAGYKTILPYDIHPHEETPLPDMKNLEERITKIEEALRNGNKSDFTSNSREVTDNKYARTGSENDTNDKVLK